MIKLKASQYNKILDWRIKIDKLAADLLKDKHHARIHTDARESEGNPDDDIVGLLFAARSNLDQIIERQ